jgi:electron transfer flavoprotein alpha subunit
MPKVEPESGSEYSGIWVFMEHHEGEMAKVSFELLGKGRELADQRGVKLTAVLLGHNVDVLAKQAVSYGADKVIYVDSPLLTKYATEPYVEASAKLVLERKPEVFLIGATHTGRDFGSRIAVRTETGCTADATRLEWDMEKVEEKNEWELIMLRPAFGGKILAGIVCPKHRPWMASARPNTFVPLDPDTNRTGEIEKIEMDLTGDYHSRIISFEKFDDKGAQIDKADIIVAAGMGIQTKDNLKHVEEVAEAINGAVAGSRKVVDNGWLARTHQVGQTGITVRPKLYIAAGISGAVQHLAGMQESGFVVSINQDDSAPIFGVSDIGIKGDLKQILPAIAAEIKKRKGA